MTVHRTREFRAVATRATVQPAHPGALYVAVVHAPDGVRLATMAGSRAGLVQRLADYVEQRGDHALWADHARHLRTLLARGELEAAIEAYFGLVGGRWDEEWLVTAVVTTDGHPDVAAVLDAVVPPRKSLDTPDRGLHHELTNPSATRSDSTRRDGGSRPLPAPHGRLE